MENQMVINKDIIHNLALTNYGDLIVEDNNLKLTYGNNVYYEAFRQILQTRLGEYYLNINEGLDFDVFIGKKEIDQDEANAAIYQAASQIYGFVRFDEISYNYNRIERILTIRFIAVFTDNTTIEIEQEVSI